MSGQELAHLSGLTEQQKRFVQWVGRGKEPEAAAQLAGYSDQTAAWRNLRLPHITAAIHAEIQRALRNEIAPAAMHLLRTIVKDEKADLKLRADVSIKLTRMAGHIEPTSKSIEQEKQLSEMTSDELRSFIDRNQAELERMERELSERAKPIDAQVSAHGEANALSYLD